MKVVINKCYGGFGLSDAARKRYANLTGTEYDQYGYNDWFRTDPILIQVIEELGEEANGVCAKLRIVDVPDDAEWEINDYDGMEHVAEIHRTWG